MKTLSLIVFFIFSGICYAGEVLTVKSMSYIGKKICMGNTQETNEEIKIPFVYSSNKYVADKINNYMFIKQFNIMAPKEYSENFTLHDEIDCIYDKSFSVEQNNGRIFALEIRTEFLRDATHNYYAFDADTGDKIFPEDLFNESGIKVLSRRFVNLSNSQNRKQIKLLKKELSNLKRKKADSKQVDDEWENDQKREIEEYEGVIIKDEDADRIFLGLNFSFNANSVDISSSGSIDPSPSLYGIGAVSMTVPYSGLKPYLTDYGKSLFLNKPGKKITKSVFDRILTGKVGEQTLITMLLDHKNSDNNFEGVYFYNKYGKAIYLNGKAVGDNLNLKEYAEDYTIRAEINLKITKDKATGIWTDGKKSIPVEIDL